MFELDNVSANWDFGVRWYPGIVAEVILTRHAIFCQ